MLWVWCVSHTCMSQAHPGLPAQGRIFTDPNCPELGPAGRAAIYKAMAAVLAALHSVKPAAVGLERYGRQSGYCKRQVCLGYVEVSARQVLPGVTAHV
jgi:hypothetical protein